MTIFDLSETNKKNRIMTITKEATCRMFGCTMEQLNAQYKANHATLDGMHGKAVKSGKKVNGYTAEQLKELKDKYEDLSGV